RAPPVRPCRTGGRRSHPGGLFSVALSFPSPGLGVPQRNALRSSDFPLPGTLRAATIRPAPARADVSRALRHRASREGAAQLYARIGSRSRGVPMAGDITLEKNIPQSLEAERSVLGAILIDNHHINRPQELLHQEHT